MSWGWQKCPPLCSLRSTGPDYIRHFSFPEKGISLDILKELQMLHNIEYAPPNIRECYSINRGRREDGRLGLAKKSKTPFF